MTNQQILDAIPKYDDPADLPQALTGFANAYAQATDGLVSQVQTIADSIDRETIISDTLAQVPNTLLKVVYTDSSRTVAVPAEANAVRISARGGAFAQPGNTSAGWTTYHVVLAPWVHGWSALNSGETSLIVTIGAMVSTHGQYAGETKVTTHTNRHILSATGARGEWREPDTGAYKTQKYNQRPLPIDPKGYAVIEFYKFAEDKLEVTDEIGRY